MLRVLGLLGPCMASAVILLQRPSACLAAETTEQALSATAYGGAGVLTVPNNERGDDEYDITRMGLALSGIVRPGAPDVSRAPVETSGFFVAFGGTFELESALHTACGFDCDGQNDTGTRYLAKHFAGRVGVGYSFPLFEFRVGALIALPDANVDYAMALLMPDVLARVGRRNRGWLELGLGAYSASTNLRPGLYVGGALGSERLLQVSAHIGVHLVNGLCCHTVTMP